MKSSCFTYINVNFERETRVISAAKVHLHPVKRRHAFFVSGIAPQEKRDEKEKREKEQKESLIVFEGVGIREARISRTIF